MKKLIFFLNIGLIISCSSNTEEIETINEIETTLIKSEIIEIYLLEPLNDSRGYCIDIMGSKSNADINKGLQSHTCYSYQGEISVDQGFDNSRINDNEFYIPFFEVCMEAEKINNLSSLLLNKCDKNPNQQFIFQVDGKIQPLSNLDLCLTVSENFREGGGGNPVHLIRDLSLQICEDKFSSQQKWGIRQNN